MVKAMVRLRLFRGKLCTGELLIGVDVRLTYYYIKLTGNRLNLQSIYYRFLPTIWKSVKPKFVFSPFQAVKLYQGDQSSEIIEIKFNISFDQPTSSLVEMRKNNFMEDQIKKANERLQWKSKKNERTMKIDEKDANDNPVYRVLRNQRDAKSILHYILGGASTSVKKNTIPQDRSKSQMDEFSFCNNSEQRYERSNSLRQRRSFRQKAAKIMLKTKKVSDQLQNSKKRIHILQKFNKKVDKYCSYLPQSIDQVENQSAVANDQLIKLCNQNLFPTEDLYRRASFYIHYKEPKIPSNKLKKLKGKFRLNTEPSQSNTEPFTRLLTLNF